MAAKKPRWLPLESNPDVMNKYIQNLGVDTSSWQYFDVYGLDPSLLAMVPRPACSLLLLFPITENYEKFCIEEEKRLTENPQKNSENLYFTEQTVGNACGTVGIIHSVANNRDSVKLNEGHLKNFLDATKNLNPKERAKKLETDTGISQCHEDSAQEGQTEVPSIDEKINLHFIAFVHKDGDLYELDGRKSFPIKHGSTTTDTFLEDTANVCKKFMKRDPALIQFNMVALAHVENA